MARLDRAIRKNSWITRINRVMTIKQKHPHATAQYEKLDVTRRRVRNQEFYMDSHKTGEGFGIVSTIRENPKQTKEFIDYHLNIGAFHIVVCFDDPEDPLWRITGTNPG